MTELVSPPVAPEERSGAILLLLAILVLMLHVFGIVWLRQPPVTEKTSSPQPFKLEVTMLSEPAPKTSTASVANPQAKPTPQKPPDAPEKTEKNNKHEPAKTQETAQTHKNKVIQQKSPVPEESTSPPKPQVVKSQYRLQTKQTVSSAMIQNPNRQTHARDNFIADELHNPSPEYPEEDIFLGYQGNAYIQIYVSAQGFSQRVEVLKSSGHKTLDEAAAKALRKWRFLPSRQGEKPVADTVIISVIFTLH